MGFEIDVHEPTRNDDSAVNELPRSVIVSQGGAGKKGLYMPQAIFHDSAASWDNIEVLQGMIETDYFPSATSAVRRLRDALGNNSGLVPAIKALGPHILSGMVFSHCLCVEI